MTRTLYLSTVQQAVRANICGRCAHRTPGSDEAGVKRRACEAGCPVFSHLSKLWDRAVRIDPMLGDVEHAMERAVDQVCRPRSPRRPVTLRTRRAVAKVLQELSGE